MSETLPATAAERAELLKAWAREEGFDRVGVAPIERSDQFGAFRRWLERGDHAGMEWIARRVERREDPREILPGAKSALCVALQYWPLEGEPEPAGDLWPRVARYARGDDYHEVMGDGLRRLGERIEEAFPGAVTRSYVDTGPVLERELAWRAGLGVQGKNTNLLHREWGSYFLLGEIFLTFELEPDAAQPDERMADICSRCTRCLDHCPTGALPEPYRLDANRCISYWTIEHRGDLPEEGREMVGEWVFGCDVCQEVCPWNYKAGEGSHPALEMPDQRRELDLEGLLALEHDEYVERFRGSPMKRAKLEGLQRNAAVAMGNRGEETYVPALRRALEEGEDVVRRHAAWSLGKIGGPVAREALKAGLERETNEVTVAEILSALRGCS